MSEQDKTIELSPVKPNFKQLPSVFAIALEQFGAIELAGEEQSKYLQGQVTCDVLKLTDEQVVTGAHCNAKGKLFSVFRLLNRNNRHLLIQPKVTIANSLAELKKFGVFAKVDIEQSEQFSFWAIAGQDSEQFLSQHFDQIPNSLSPVVQQGPLTLVYIAGSVKRYLLISDNNDAVAAIIGQNAMPIYQHQVWDLLEISEGFANFQQPTADDYVPQMLNLQAIDGISFTKGCYLGQETVARMQYLGRNKRALFSLAGQVESNEANDESFATVEQQLGENWRRAGDVISYYRADDGTTYLQAVLASDIANDTKLRLKHLPESEFTLEPLPYSLDQDGK